MGISVEGGERAGERIGEMAERAANVRPLLETLAAELRAMVDRSFATDSAPDGRPWAPRVQAFRYADGRPARPRTETRPGRGLLEDSGDLRSSISVTVQGGSVVAEAVSGHAAAQQFGTRHMPARPFLPVDRSGPMANGPAGEWFAALPRRVAEYVARGSL